MTAFQAIVFGIVHGFTEFLPVGSTAHRVLVPYLLGWPEPSGAFAGALSLGALLAVLVYFRHDWASILSSFLQMILFRKKPMTLDERLPFFIALASLPSVGAWYYLHGRIADIQWNPIRVALALAVFGVPMVFADSLNRRNKSMFDWNWLDSLIVGVTQCMALVPGCGRLAGALPGALARNYNREAASKFVFFAMTPLIAASAYIELKGVSLKAPAPMEGLTWMSFSLALILSLGASLLAIGAFMKHVQRNGLGQYVVYRCLVAAAVLVVFYLRTRAL